MAEKEKSKIISLSVSAEMNDRLKNSARKLGHKNVSQMVRDLIDKYLDLLVNEKDDVPVIIRIPSDLKDNFDSLKDWLQVKVDAITKAVAGDK